MNLIQRSCDVISSSEMEDLGGLKSFPIYMGCVSYPQSEDIYADMLWHISPHNGLLQLKSLIPLEILYAESHDAGTVGNIWMKHHKAFANFIREYNPLSLLEIGGAHGILSKLYQEDSINIDWTILEPNPIPVKGVKAKFIKGFFDDKFSLGWDVDAVVHSHVFEHIYEPVSFIRNISNFLDNGKYLIFSLPNMREMLARKYNNCINFEHTVLLTEPYIDYLLAFHGFRLVKREYFLDDHSIFYACIRDTSVLPVKLSSSLYHENKKLFQEYVAYYESLILDLNTRIAGLSTGQKLFLFGAHVFAQYLIGFGLDTSRIECLLDNDANKHGKRLYGTNFVVYSPKILEQCVAPVVILKAGVYNDEIKADILANINQNTIFFE